MTPLDLEAVAKQIKLDEGYREMPYRDTLNHWTVGWGHWLEADDIPKHMALIGTVLDYITDKNTHERWFDEDFAGAVDDAKRYAGPDAWPYLPAEIRGVLINMAFQLGALNLSQFVETRKAMLAGDWRRMSAEILDSLLAEQTPARTLRHARIVKSLAGVA